MGCWASFLASSAYFWQPDPRAISPLLMHEIAEYVIHIQSSDFAEACFVKRYIVHGGFPKRQLRFCLNILHRLEIPLGWIATAIFQ